MIVFLNGASSSGKTSLARSLQSIWPQGPLLYISLDQVIGQLPFAYTGDGPSADQGFPIVGDEVRVGPYGHALNLACGEHALGLHDRGFDLVIDYVLLNEEVLAAFDPLFRQAEVFFVGITCSDSELERRNQQRPDRVEGLAVAQQKSVHFCSERYDLLLDSSEQTSAAMGAKLLEELLDKKGLRR